MAMKTEVEIFLLFIQLQTESQTCMQLLIFLKGPTF